MHPCRLLIAAVLVLSVASSGALGQELYPVEQSWTPECFCPATCYELGGTARGYYINDQRIEFSGQEATFAVEGVLDGQVLHQVDDWTCDLTGELFFTQPYDRNILVDSPERESFAGNWDIDPLSISQLSLGAARGDWYFAIGRFPTPFGRYYFTNYRNNFDDSPFIRSEAILFRETGMLAEWNPDGYAFAAAITNGGPNQDANSSKALVARAGIDREHFACGTSIKLQDGIGSEGQKMYNEHLGLDVMFRRGCWTLSGEVIYDHYGFRRPGFDPLDIFWGRSLYFRDLNKRFHEPITGVGWYANLGYEGPQWSLAINYGEFYPEELRVREHDEVTRRGILKASRHWSMQLETYAALMLENDLPLAFAGHDRRGVYVLFGCQFTL